MSKWTAWYNSLPEHTRRYLDSRSVWNDRDVFVFLGLGIVLGILIGQII